MAFPPCEMLYELSFGPATGLGKKVGRQGVQKCLLRISGEKFYGETAIFQNGGEKPSEKILTLFDGEHFKSLDNDCLRFSRGPGRIVAVADLMAQSLPYCLMQFLSLGQEWNQTVLPSRVRDQELIFATLKGRTAHP